MGVSRSPRSSPPARAASPASTASPSSPAMRLRASAGNLKQPYANVETVLASPGSAHLSRPQSRSPPPPSASSNISMFSAPPAIITAVPPPSSPSLSLNALTHSYHAQSASSAAGQAQSRPSSPPRSGSSSPARSIVSDAGGLFERDIEFSAAHVLSAHEAVDVAIPPVLSEAAIAIATTPAIDEEATTVKRTASETSLLRRNLIAGGIGSRPGELGEDPHGATTEAERAVFPPSPPSPMQKKGWQSPTYTLELAQQDSAAVSSGLLDPNTGSPRQPRRSLSPGAQRPSQVPFPVPGQASPSPLATPPLDDPAVRRLSFMSYSDLINAERGTTPLDTLAHHLSDGLPSTSASPPLAKRGRDASPLHA